MSTYLVYVRRSYKRADAADVSDETQEAVARSLIPAGASVEVIRDSGGHNSGATDDRAGYRQLIARVQQGGITGVAVYDLSRLSRNVALMSRLREELERQQVTILAGNLPNTKHDSAVGRFMFNMVVSAAQFQRDLDSERMTAMMRATFEAGGHRGNDPFGLRTKRDETGAVVKPRQLVIDPDEAEVVRRIFHLLADHPFSEVADTLNREGVRHRSVRAWTKNAVKDVWRRREVYVGNVTSKRGAEVREGRHDAILTPAEYREAAAGVERRIHRRAVRDNNAKRFYLLGGLVYCSCGTRMHGTAQISRGKTWLYFVCPVSERRRAVLDEHGDLVACHAKRVRADAADAFVLDALRTFRLPDEAMGAIREELERRRKAEKPGDLEKQRDRLEQTLARLGQRFDWGELDEGEYRSKVGEVRRQLAALPSPDDKLIVFDRYRAEVRGFAETVDAGNDEDRRRFVATLVERVETDDRQVVRVVWTAPARPFFRDMLLLGGAPPDGLEGSPSHSDAGLEWYAAS